MKITFYGAAREVTGSMHLLSSGSDRILLDCGMFQGHRKQSAEKNQNFPIDASTVTNMVLSHAHIDHSGRIPLLVKNGLSGRIVCTRVTADACAYLLVDSARIQESDADYLNYKIVRNALSRMDNGGEGKAAKKRRDIRNELKTGNRINTEKVNELLRKHRMDGIEPLYRPEDAELALNHMDSYPFRYPVTIGRDITCTLYEAGHILGSAITMINIGANGRKRTICYTGDLGRFGKPILKDPALVYPEEHRDVDLMIMESTYGNRVHEPLEDLKPALKSVLSSTLERGGSVIIPAFAFGRTQELLYRLHELLDQQEIEPVPVYVDSPLATNLTRVFGEHPEVYDAETHETFLKKGKNPFFFDGLKFVDSVEASMALNRDEHPHIVIAASGMCEAGRVLHHLRHKIHNPKHTILIVGYMAQNTLGRRILEKGMEFEASGRRGEPPMLKFFNKEYPLKAHVEKIGGFSAHADRDELLGFLKKSNLRIRKIALVHGEEDATRSFAGRLAEEGYSVVVPEFGQSLEVD